MRLSVAGMMLAVLSANCATSAEQAGGKPVPSSAPPSGKLVTAEVPPDLIEKMRADLAQHAGISASAAKVVRAESIQWPDGALGCPQPGEMYTQAIVSGYIVQFTHEGRTYSYHASKQGFFKRCDNPKTQGADVR
jgi:hypothetical protein